MSTLTITLPSSASVQNGKHVTFRAPCDSTVGDKTVTGLLINNVVYTLMDVFNNPISEGSLMFREGAMIYVILDVDKKIATIQNAGGVTSFNGRVGRIKSRV